MRSSSSPTGRQPGRWASCSNFGLYPVDAIRAVLGLEARSVYATSGAFFYDGDADDLSVLALTFERGVIATTSVGRAPTQGHPNGYGGDRRLRIMGSHGTLAVDAAAPSLSVYGERPTQRYYGAESLRALVDHFVAAVRGEQAPELGPRDARAALEIILAARTSALEHRVVELNGGALETRHLPHRIRRRAPRRAARRSRSAGIVGSRSRAICCRSSKPGQRGSSAREVVEGAR